MLTGAFDIKERVREATDIVELIGASHSLRRQGRHYVTLCPWHEDSRPSLQINPDRQTWKCWVCDIGGDVFSYVMREENVDFREALQMLADRAGIEIKQSQRSFVEPGSPDDKKTLLAAVAWAVDQYHRFLLNSSDAEDARRYLADRQISAESIQTYSIGFAPNEWRWLLDSANGTPFSPSVLEAAGLVIKSDRKDHYYDRYRGRVLFPIRDPQRRPIGLGGRILPQFSDDSAAKYINSPETRLYTKSDQLYGLDIARQGRDIKQHGIIVMEGYTDVIMSWQHGIDNVVAVCGTSLTERHVKLLKRFADRITLVLDGDEAGRKKANSVLEMFITTQTDLRIVTLPDGLDPCDFLLSRGAEAFRDLLKNAPDALEHKIHTTMQQIDPIRDTHQANVALQDLLSTIARAPRIQDGGGLGTRLREQQVLNRLGREFRIPDSELRTQLKELRSAARRRIDAPKPGLERPQEKPRLQRYECDLFELLFLQPEVIPTVLERVSLHLLATPEARRLLETYADLEAQGIYADVSRLLIEFDDPNMKSLIVSLDEDAQRKADCDRDEALRDLLLTFERKQAEEEIRNEKAQLSAMPIEEGVQKLQEILRKRREVSET